jgi:protein-disulfide isomerase
MKVIDVRYLVVFAALTALSACGEKSSTPAADTAAAPAADTAATAAAPGKQNWTEVSATTPEGGFRLGNPDAKVKLVEYASLTCPHCKDFHEEAAATIRSKYVAGGNVSYEYRNFILNGPDYAATLLARCQGGAQFFNLINAFYQAQSQWVEPFAKLSEADSKRLGALPEDQQIGALAKVGGLDAFMRARGMTSAKFDQCVADKAAIKRLAEIRDKASADGVAGTPTFLINGVKQESTTTWSQLEPKLQAALL